MNDDFTTKVYVKLEEISKDMTELKITSAKQEVNLQEHMKRSDMLEAKMVPIEQHVSKVDGALKLIGFIGIISGIVLSVFEISSFFLK